MSSLRCLESYVKVLRTKTDIENAKEPSETELWAQIDAIEGKIIDCQYQKIENNSTIEDYDDELFELERVLQFKKEMTLKLDD